MFDSLILQVVFANFGFWFNLLIPVAAALFLAFTHREYIWKEFAIQSGATLVYVAAAFTLLFSTTTDMWDTNYMNGKVASSTYYEEWTELVHYTESYSCGTSKAPRTCTRQKTRRDYHGPYWQIKTNLGETISIKRGDYLKMAREFGQKEVNLNRSGQVSWGDGDKFVSYPSKSIPTSVGHSYENVVAAANNNVIHVKVPKETVAQLVKTGKVRNYPALYKGPYGETLLNRFVDTTGKVKDSRAYLNELNSMSMLAGKSKQANPIVYVTNEGMPLKEALSQHWKMGKKNDVTLILGVDDDGTVQWSDVICFTNNTGFKYDMQNDFNGKNINSDKDFILTQMALNITDGYIRKPMKEFAYLKENITLEWYWQLLILLGNIGLSGYITYKFLNNYDRKRNW